MLDWNFPVRADEDYKYLCFVEENPTGIENRLWAGRSGVRIPLGEQIPDHLWRPVGTAVLSPGYCGRGVKLITHLRLAEKLRMCGAVPQLPVYDFMTWTGKTLT